MSDAAAKPRDLSAYPKAVLVEYLRGWCLVNRAELDRIQIRLALEAAHARVKELYDQQAKIKFAKRPDLYFALQRRINALEARSDKLFERLMKSHRRDDE